jgi:hypothetical protein
MTAPTPDDRATLGQCMEALASLDDTVTIDDFRLEGMLRSDKTRRQIRRFILAASIAFLALALLVLFAPIRNKLFSAAVWALALGGLGAVSAIFVNTLNLVPQQTLKTYNFFEVWGRTVLGCIFGVILATTIVVAEMTEFFKSLDDPSAKLNSSVQLLVPFFAGFSTTLVLNLFEKMIRSIETTIGVDNQRSLASDAHRPERGRRTGR